jgi:hypothetical protein
MLKLAPPLRWLFFVGVAKICPFSIRIPRKGGLKRKLDPCTTEHSMRLIFASIVELWELLREMHILLCTNSIAWKCVPSRAYSATPAYRCQFLGSQAPFDMKKIWRKHAEPKCRFCAWLVVHTADVLALEGGLTTRCTSFVTSTRRRLNIFSMDALSSLKSGTPCSHLAAYLCRLPTHTKQRPCAREVNVRGHEDQDRPTHTARYPCHVSVARYSLVHINQNPKSWKRVRECKFWMSWLANPRVIENRRICNEVV